MLSWLITGVGMAAIGWLVWSLLPQGPATPPNDDPPVDNQED